MSIQFADAQVTDTTKAANKESYKFYLQKRKTNNIIGFVLLGAGIIMTVSGLAESGPFFSDNPHRGEALSIAGAVTTLSSIPFFIMASKNKRKAKLALKEASITLNNTNIGFNNKPYRSVYPGLSLSFNFNH